MNRDADALWNHTKAPPDDIEGCPIIARYGIGPNTYNIIAFIGLVYGRAPYVVWKLYLNQHCRWDVENGFYSDDLCRAWQNWKERR